VYFAEGLPHPNPRQVRWTVPVMQFASEPVQLSLAITMERNKQRGKRVSERMSGNQVSHQKEVPNKHRK